MNNLGWVYSRSTIDLGVRAGLQLPLGQDLFDDIRMQLFFRIESTTWRAMGKHIWLTCDYLYEGLVND